MDWQGYIEQDPGVMLGKPVIRGTRLTVELNLERLKSGTPEADILDAYPQLRRAHIEAAMAYARHTGKA